MSEVSRELDLLVDHADELLDAIATFSGNVDVDDATADKVENVYQRVHTIFDDLRNLRDALA